MKRDNNFFVSSLVLIILSLSLSLHAKRNGTSWLERESACSRACTGGKYTSKASPCAQTSSFEDLDLVIR